MDILIVGCYTTKTAPGVVNGQEIGRGICLYGYNGSEKGKLLHVEETANPSYLAMYKKFLFAVSEVEDAAIVKRYELREEKGKNPYLVLVKELKLSGFASCHVEIYEKENLLFLSDYGSGDVKVIDISEDLNLVEEWAFEGQGPCKERQESSHIHSCRVWHDVLYVADLGSDCIYRFQIVERKLKQLETIHTRPGAGPRHMEFSDTGNGQFLYVVNELDCTLSVYENGKEIQTLWLYQDEFDGNATAADICRSKDGYFYVSVRGSDDIFIFRLEEHGYLRHIQHQSVQGQGPRSICLDTSQEHLIAANQTSSNVVVFKRINGMLMMAEEINDIPAPAKVLIWKGELQ